MDAPLGPTDVDKGDILAKVTGIAGLRQPIIALAKHGGVLRTDRLELVAVEMGMSLQDLGLACDLKFGPQGIDRGGSVAAWKAGDATASEVPAVSERAVDAKIAYCEQVWNRYRRCPATYPPFHALMGFEAHRLDADFHDRFYQPAVLSERHRRYRRAWHPADGC